MAQTPGTLHLKYAGDETSSRSGALGFSTLEVIVVLAIGLVIVVLGVPSLSRTQAVYRASGDAKSLAQSLTLAKMRAGSNFTQERVTVNTANNTFQLEQYDKTNSSWIADGGTQYLSAGVTFGYGSITTPAGSQSLIANSTPVIFNSRGIPVNGANQPTSEDVVYISNSSGYYAITVALSGRIQTWKYTNGAWVTQ